MTAQYIDAIHNFGFINPDANNNWQICGGMYISIQWRHIGGVTECNYIQRDITQMRHTMIKLPGKYTTGEIMYEVSRLTGEMII